MATQTLRPLSITVQTGCTGAVSALTNDPDSGNDGNWVTANSSTTDVVLEVNFADAAGTLTTGSGLQEIRARVRGTDGANTPDNWALHIYEGTTLRQTILNTNNPNGSEAVISGTWDASILSTQDASADVRARFTCTADTSPPGQVASADVDSIEWNVTYTSGDQQKNVSDSGGGSDAAPSISSIFSLADSGAGAESLAGAISLALADSGSASDLLSQIAAAVAISDSGAGAEAAGSPSILAILSVSDSGAGASVVGIQVAFALSDSGAGSDDVNLITETLKQIADAASGSDVVSSISVLTTISDSGAGSDAPTVYVSLSLADIGSGTEAISIDAALELLDSAIGSDSATGFILISVPDTGSSDESLAIAASALVSDAGTGVEGLTISAQITISDSGTIDELITASEYLILKQISDTAGAVDGLGISVVSSVSDSGAGTEQLTISAQFVLSDPTNQAIEAISTSALILAQDLASALDALASVQVSLEIPESGTGGEALAVASALQVLDDSAAIDSAFKFDPDVRLCEITATFYKRYSTILYSSRQAAFSLSTRQISFVLN